MAWKNPEMGPHGEPLDFEEHPPEMAIPYGVHCEEQRRAFVRGLQLGLVMATCVVGSLWAIHWGLHADDVSRAAFDLQVAEAKLAREKYLKAVWELHAMRLSKGWDDTPKAVEWWEKQKEEWSGPWAKKVPNSELKGNDDED